MKRMTTRLGKHHVSLVVTKTHEIRAAQQIKFAKMPVRNRAGSSPMREIKAEDGAEAFTTSPSRRPADGRLRSGSNEAVEAIKQRARKGTMTSSDMSSENELDPHLFKRRQVDPRKPVKASRLPQEKGVLLNSKNAATTIDEDSAEFSDRTSLSSEFGASVDSESILNHVGQPRIFPMDPIQSTAVLSTESPKKNRSQPSVLQALPPPRPISTIQPKSLLGQAIRTRRSNPKNPLESFAVLSGKGVLDPLNIRMYAPFSENPSKPFEMPLLRTVSQEGSFGKKPVMVADAIGLSLWRYCEEQLQPPIEASKLYVNRWTLRMMEDGEVDYDFPALSRNRPMGDFTSNNNRATRGRGKETSYDEFALVEATDAQTMENQALTPRYDKLVPSVKDDPMDKPKVPHHVSQEVLRPIKPASSASVEKPIYIHPDRSTMPGSQLTPRIDPLKVLKIHYTSLEALTQTTSIEITTETYLAEVLDAVCKRWKLDRAWHILKVTGTNTVAPGDRTVEALGALTDLDVVRRRFANEGNVGLAGSPGSSSPNAPLLLTSSPPPRKGKRGVQPVTQNQEHLNNGVSGRYKRYNVIRKQPMSFAPSHQRVLQMDDDYMHILPAETSKNRFDSSAKTSRVPFSMIVGCKVSRRHPKTFRVRCAYIYIYIHSSSLYFAHIYTRRLSIFRIHVHFVVLRFASMTYFHMQTMHSYSFTDPLHYVQSDHRLPRTRNQALRFRGPNPRRSHGDCGRGHQGHGAIPFTSTRARPDTDIVT